MRAKLAAVLTMCLALSGTIAPAFAADDEPLNKVVAVSLLPVRVAGFGAGMLIGWPVATLRETYSSYMGFTEKGSDKLPGGHASAPTCVVASILTVPAAVAVGSVKGLYYGTKNAAVHGFNEPFHPDSFSLGKLDE